MKQWSDQASLQDAIAHGLKEKEFALLEELLGRPLSMLEVGICSALYSEHCSYKSTKVHLRGLPTEGPQVIQGPGENAGVVDIGDGEAVVFKVESHNHPSFIEPFQGAATGVGGILRDVFTMGARPLALMNALRFGAVDNERTPYLLSRAVAGIGFYGNCVGVPTVRGELFFHEAYNGNCLVNAFALGLVEHDKIFLGRAAGPGNAIIYAGSKTGRDGIHGATMASESFGESSDEKRPTVQVGDPFQEKLLIEACLEVMQSGVVVGIQDMGAAGLTSSSFEMAERAGSGVVIDLDKVPQREAHMNPYELMLSESQERMLLVVERGKEQQVIDIFTRWELDAVKIGEVTDGDSVDLRWDGEVVSSLPVSVVTSAVPQYRWAEEVPADFEARRTFSIDQIGEPADLSQTWLEMLGSPNCCSRAPLFSQYDSTVRGNTVVHPGSDAGVIRIKSDSRPREKGVALTIDCNSRFCAIDPRHGTALSLAEAYRNISAVGARPLAVSDCLNFGSPERPESMWQIAESIRGLGDASRALELPIVSGNVSLYNETRGKSVLPTPMLAVVGLIDDASLAVSSCFKHDDDIILLLGETLEQELGGSEYLAFHGHVERGALPRLDYDLEVRTAEAVRSLIARKLLQSCHDLSAGGLAVALAECCLSGIEPRGAVLRSERPVAELTRRDGLLFAESGARYLVSLRASDEAGVRSVLEQFKIPVSMRGVVGGEKIAVQEVASITVHDAYQRWAHGLQELFR